mmetsp:Transcript_6909/g.12233  ORF Transcript_6909/g.12233 Transcript_6909/m.12233 type:complete len:132 (-) Transcript_6909:21-416(-)
MAKTVQLFAQAFLLQSMGTQRYSLNHWAGRLLELLPSPEHSKHAEDVVANVQQLYSMLSMQHHHQLAPISSPGLYLDVSNALGVASALVVSALIWSHRAPLTEIKVVYGDVAGNMKKHPWTLQQLALYAAA